MLIKNFQASTVQKALDQVRREFGEDAVILKTDIVKERGRKSFSVTAAKDQQSPGLSDKLGTPVEQPKRTMSTYIDKNAAVRGLDTLLLDLLLPDILSDSARTCYQMLRDHEVEVDVAAGLCRELQRKADSSVRTELTLLLQALLSKTVELPAEGKHVFFVGPPGSGKSSALAKMAAQLVFCEGRKVKLSTLDNFRPTAEAEIENLAEVLGFVEGESEPSGSVRTGELLLIDSEGLVPGDDENLEQLREAISEMQERHVILVLSAATSWRNNRRYLDFLSPLGIDSVVITGLDLSASCGTVINISAGDYPPILGVTDSRMPTGEIEPLDVTKHMKGLIGGLDVG